MCAALLSVSACVSATCVALAGLALTWQLPYRRGSAWPKQTLHRTADGFSEHYVLEVRLTFVLDHETPLYAV